MNCTSEEIEQKRLIAIQKRQNNFTSRNNSNNGSNLQLSPVSSYVKSYSSNISKTSQPYAKPKSDNEKNAYSSITKVVSGTVYLISETRFEVNPSEFCNPLISLFKTIPSRSFDPKSRLWSFSIDDYEKLMSKVATLAPNVVLGTLPQYVLKLLKELYIDPDNVDISPIEPTLRFKLMPFQEKGVRFGIAKSGRCMIADDMGLGKTFQALAIASYYRSDWPMLIVTTSSMRETWQAKIRELMPSVPMSSVVTVSGGRDAQLAANKHTEVVIISYKMTTTHTQLLKNKKFGVVIIDESHYLKSHKAQCTAALAGVCKSACRVLLLSGTPALSRPVELYTQLNIIAPNFFGGYIEYGKRYCAGKISTFGWDMTGCSNLVELQVILQRKFLIRRTKEQVHTLLEDKTRESIFLDQSLLEYSKADQTGLTQMAEQYAKTKSSDRHAALLTFFSESARVKIPAICKYLRQLVHDELTGKFLVFAHHKNMIEAICTTLDELCIHYICIVGSTPTNTRAELVDKFQLGESCRCAVLSITAASAGLTLTAANLVLFAELHWNPGILIQAEARAHRIGQRGGVCARYLLARGTSDDYMWPLLQDKLNVLNEVGLSKDTFEGNTLKTQSGTDIASYFKESLKNRNDYVPGTNIRKSLESATSNGIYDRTNCDSENRQCSEPENTIDKSLLDDEEGDELLLQLDL